MADNTLDLARLPKVIHSPVRLAVVAALQAGGEERFTKLKEVVGATDGNLTIHLRVLEENGIVKVRKSFVGRRPRTTYQLTRKGHQVFSNYISVMAQMVEGFRGGRSRGA